MKSGWKLSQKTKDKMSLAFKGRKATKTSFKKGVYHPWKGKFGKEHPAWKGGVSINQKDYLKNLRKAVVEALGNKCISCGFDDIRALQIDHVNGGGSKERKTRGYKGSFHSNVLKSFLNKESKYQLLCANCNWIKRFENKEAKGKPIILK